ncbi:MAG TPA: hypothetical protein DDZ88_19995 [Verrucomicrobiales bacterium]|nr:hypothetical protein [Verrucomicrobiales bacterium]
MNLLTDDAPDHIVEAAAETARKAAFESLNAWHGLPLVWTSSRAGLYDFLRIPAPVLSQATLDAIKAARAAEGTAEADALQDRANALFMTETGGSTGHVRNAQIILWLAAHQPKDWRSIAHDRGKLLEVIDEWTDENVAPSEIQDLAEVTNHLLTEADKTRAIVRPKHTNPDEEGN